MKATIFILVLAAATAAAKATTITGLYDTGVNTLNVALVPANSTNNVADPIFTTNPGTMAYTFFIPAYYNEALLTDNARWISTASICFNCGPAPTLVFATAAGNYDYTETFSLPSGVLPSTVDITGSWATDNCGTILVNGIATNQTVGGGVGNCTAIAANFNSLTPFHLTGAYLASIGVTLSTTGPNTIDFQVFNAGSSTALLVTNLQGTGSTPELVTALFTLTGLVLMGMRITPLGRHTTRS